MLYSTKYKTPVGRLQRRKISLKEAEVDEKRERMGPSPGLSVLKQNPHWRRGDDLAK